MLSSAHSSELSPVSAASSAQASRANLAIPSPDETCVAPGPFAGGSLGMQPQAAIPHVVSQRANMWFFHDVTAVSRFFSANKYTCFMHEGTEHVATESLSSLEARLAAWGFMRTHRADLINLAHVQSIRRVRYTFEITLKDGQRATASRRLVQALRTRLSF